MKQQTRWQRCPRNKRTRGERQERKAGRGGVGTEWWSAQRKHDASLRHGVMDGTHRLINQTHWKGRMLRRVFGATLPHALGCREERRVKNVGADARTHRKRRAWPNLARLMKNGQETAYLACPSHHSSAAPPHFLLLHTPNPLPLLFIPYMPFQPLLSLLDSHTLICVVFPLSPPSTNTENQAFSRS